MFLSLSGPGSSVGIATKGWTVRGSNPGGGGGEILRTCPDRPWGPPSLLYNGYRVFPGGKERPGRDADPSPPSSAVGHERVELYLYSPYGPYGLYRASVPVQRCTLPSLTISLYRHLLYHFTFTYYITLPSLTTSLYRHLLYHFTFTYYITLPSLTISLYRHLLHHFTFTYYSTLPSLTTYMYIT